MFCHPICVGQHNHSCPRISCLDFLGYSQIGIDEWSCKKDLRLHLNYQANGLRIVAAAEGPVSGSLSKPNQAIEQNFVRVKNESRYGFSHARPERCIAFRTASIEGSC